MNPQTDFAKKRSGKLHTLRFGIFALNWGEESQFLKPEAMTFLAQLEGNAEQKENLKKNFEELRRLMTEKFKLDVYSNKSPIDHQFYTTNVNIANTGVYNDQRSVGAAGAVTGVGEERLSVPYLWIFVGMVKSMATKYPFMNPVIAHEFCHTVAISVGRAKESRWGFVGESYANFIGMRASQTCRELSQFHESRFLGLDNLQFRYATWIWWDFLARHPQLGFEFTGDMQQRRLLPGESCFSFMRRIVPFDCAEEDKDSRKEGFANLYGEFARSAVNYSYYEEEGLDYFKQATDQKKYQRRWSPYLQKIGVDRYRISDWLAPQALAFNAIDLVLDPKTKEISVGLAGWQIPERESEWRACLVAKLKAAPGKPKEAWTEMWKSGTLTVNLEDWSKQLGADIEKLTLVVAAVPKAWPETESHARSKNLVAYQEADRYVYDLRIRGAWPLGGEPVKVLDSAKGAPHPNGGGFVASTARVAPTAYVGPEAQVLGAAQVLDQARIEGHARVEDQAVVSGHAIVSSSALVSGKSQVKDFATIRDHATLFNDAVVEGEASVLNDGIALGGMKLRDQARLMGTPVGLTLKADCQFSGTSLVDGCVYLNKSDSFSAGTAYDKWKDSSGLLAHYDFQDAHPYRIKDQHANNDGYYLDYEGNPGIAPHYNSESSLKKQTLQLEGKGIVELPRWLLDSRDYRVEVQVLSGKDPKEQTLLEASTALGELWELKCRPEGNHLKWTWTGKDRLGVESRISALNSSLSLSDWSVVRISYDGEEGKLKLSVSNLKGNALQEQVIDCPFRTREMDYDTLKIRLGNDGTGKSPWLGQVGDLAFYRRVQ